MDIDQLSIRLTIWLALAAYGAGEVGRAGLWGAALGHATARLCWTTGCLLYVAHVVSAFSFQHAWSHEAAYENTARQTANLVGLDWGGGIYVNYAFSALWVSETIWWWVSPESFRHRSRWIDRTVRGIFLFMIVNGAAVFVEGPMRWVGLALVGVLALTWKYARPVLGDVRSS